MRRQTRQRQRTPTFSSVTTRVAFSNILGRALSCQKDNSDFQGRAATCKPNSGIVAETGRIPHISNRCSSAEKAHSVSLAVYIVHLRYAEIVQAVAHASRSFYSRTLRLLAIFKKTQCVGKGSCSSLRSSRYIHRHGPSQSSAGAGPACERAQYIRCSI